MKHCIPLLALIFVVSFLMAAATAPKPNITLQVRVYDSIAGEPIQVPANPLGRSFVRIQDRSPLTTINIAGTEVAETEHVAVYFWDYGYDWVNDGRAFEVVGNGDFRVVCVDIIARE